MATIETIAALRVLAESCSPPRWDGASEFRLIATKSIPFALLRALSADDVFASVSDAGLQHSLDSAAPGEVPVGGEMLFRPPQSIDRLMIVPEVFALLHFPAAQQQEPAAYVVFADPARQPFFSHFRGDPVEGALADVQRYQQAVRLWTVLKEQADHIDNSTGALLFFGVRRIEIHPGFQAPDLAGDVTIDDIADFVKNPDRQDTRREIFASVLSEFLRDQTSANAFRWLLRGSETFARRLREGMAIYLAEHSPERLAEEARAAGLDFSEKLEKIIGGLEAKSLTIPAAVLLAVKEVQQGAGWTILNSVIVVSGLTYAITMVLVHLSQTTLLSLLNTTIATTEKELTDKGLEQTNPVLQEFFVGLKKRVMAATYGSLAMSVASLAPAACVIIAMFYGTSKLSPTRASLLPAGTRPSIPAAPAATAQPTNMKSTPVGSIAPIFLSTLPAKPSPSPKKVP